MRKVVSPEEVAHLWANKVQDEAYTQSRNLYFEYKEIYSYGRHFMIAKHIDGGVLFTTRSYSVTTAKHIGIVRSAASHLNLIFCPNPADSPYGNEQSYLRNVRDIEASLIKARKKLKYLNEILSLLAQADKYFDAVEWEPSKDYLEVKRKYENAESSPEFDAWIKKEKEAEKKRVQKQWEQWEKYVEAWKSYDDEIIYAQCPDRDMVALRVTVDNCHVESTKGVEVEIPYAKLLINAYETGRMKHGDKINYYTITSVTDKGIRAGCHFIPKSEIEYIKQIIQ